MDIEGALDRYFEKLQARIAKNIRTELQYLGVESVNRIRDKKDNWTDRTGNLRSSIGYAYYEQGKKLIESAFEQVGIGTEGTSRGRALVDSLAKEMASTYGLAVVAGMDYASYVEAKGHDVLASTELWLRTEFEKRINDAIEDAIEAMNRERII